MANAVRRTVLRTGGLCGAAALGVAYYQRLPRRPLDHRTAHRESMTTRLYQSIAAPLIFQIEPETAHRLALQVAGFLQRLRLLWEPAWTGPTPLDWLLRPGLSSGPALGPSMRQELFGGRLRFDSPVGIAAGFDKNAELVPLYRLDALPGLGFAEVGSISAEPAAGNPRPRCFRVIPDSAVINRMGLNNEGSSAIAERLQQYSVLGRASQPAADGRARSPVGVNIAKTHSPAILGEAAVADFVTSFKRLAPHADFVVLNVSCPNTEEGKTFEDPEPLAHLLGAVGTARAEVFAPGSAPPVLVKLSPPPDTDAGRDQLRRLIGVVEAAGFVEGLVVSNTAGDRDVPLSEAGRSAAREIGRGGLSGRPLRGRSTAAVRTAYEVTGGRLPIVGCGGVDSAEAAYEKVRAGASLVEVYSSMVYKGPGVLEDIEVGLRRLLHRDGFSCLEEAVGVDVPAVPRRAQA